MMNRQSLSLALGALLALSACVHAAPYYFYYADANEQKAPSSEPAELAKQAAEQVQQAAGSAKDAVNQAVQQQQQPTEGQLPSRISGHLSELYNHGSSAVRSVVDSVQPDIKNIGKDLSEVYQATRSEVGKRIEPLAQTVRPYIENAQKVVAPFVNQAREEVPKLIQQAGPALSKVGGSVRDGLTGMWSKIQGTTAGEQQPAGQAPAVKDMQEQIQAAAEKAKQHVSNTVSQAAGQQQTST